MQAELIKTLIENPHLLKSKELEVKETHISWVLIGDKFAYKIKKAVNFGFLDFEDLQSRKKYCELELKLNKDMGASFYEEVINISGDAQNPLIDDNSAPIEYALKMKKFDTSLELSYLEQKGELSATHILELVQKLVDWHLKAPIITKATGAYGTPKEVEKPVLENFDFILSNIDDKKNIADVNSIAEWAQGIFKANLNLLKQRYNGGMIKNCHGDLHLANVVIYQGQVMPFDCIEFNLEFRYIDVINDLAFLLMDLDAKKQVALSNLALNRYLQLSGDYQALPLLNYYKSYRAMVRAKVNLLDFIHSQDEAKKQQAKDNFLDYINLAKSYTFTKIPYLVLITGVSGSGKSTLATKIAQASGALHLNSDVVRKKLFGLKEKDSSKSLLGAGIYTKEANIKTYKKLEDISFLALKNGISVILDATFLKRDHRQTFIDIANNLGLNYLLIGFEKNEKLLKARIDERVVNGDSISEADFSVLKKQLKIYQNFDEIELEQGILLKLDEKDPLKKVLNIIKKLSVV